ncbi:MAG: hypothetical protein ACFFDF_03975 [Candidatus Odinarchaeota archaeon]
MPRPNNPDKPRTQINVKRETRNRLNQLKFADESLDYVIQKLLNNHIPKSPFKVSQSTNEFIYQIKFKYGLNEDKIFYLIINYIRSKPEILDELFGNQINGSKNYDRKN